MYKKKNLFQFLFDTIILKTFENVCYKFTYFVNNHFPPPPPLYKPYIKVDITFNPVTITIRNGFDIILLYLIALIYLFIKIQKMVIIVCATNVINHVILLKYIKR